MPSEKPLIWMPPEKKIEIVSLARPKLLIPKKPELAVYVDPEVARKLGEKVRSWGQ